MQVTLENDGTELRVDGPHYLEVLRRAHAALRPRSYFEIGTLHGDTLRLATCPSIAVDPHFQLAPELKSRLENAKWFEQTSDDFFADQRPDQLLGRPIDLAFLDGMHEFEFLLRDFIATERHCRPASIIVLHDCLPGDDFMTRPFARSGETGPTNFPGWWTGDVWKLVPILRRHRPALKLVCLDAMPTGLVAVTNLRPGDRTLSANYDRLVAEWRAVRLADFGMARLLSTAAPESSEAWLATLKPFGVLDRLKRDVRGVLARSRILRAA